MSKRVIASLVCLTFIFSNLQYVHAHDFNVNQLPVPGTMVGISSPFTPLALKGLVVNPLKPLEFQFLVDTGKEPGDATAIREEAQGLVKYFLAGLTIPEGNLWVNLSPYEKNRIIPEALGQTNLGRDLLAQDYILKQLTASLIYPEHDLGKEFWSRVYAKAQQQFGTTNVQVNSFNKVWILPDQAQVYVNVNAAYVTKSTLKVMLDEDYTALQKHMPVRNGTDSIGANIVRQIILPEIEKEVNTGKNFSTLRQIYQALILAKWYKETFQNGLLDAVYTNKNKVAGVNLHDLTVKEQIYNRYLRAYKKGVFNYIKEDIALDGQVAMRRYFSGGIPLIKINLRLTQDPAMVSRPDGAMIAVKVDLEKPADLAMTTDEVNALRKQVDKKLKNLEIAKLNVMGFYSLGKIQEAIRGYPEFLRAMYEYNQTVDLYNLNVENGAKIGLITETKEEKASFKDFSTIEKKLKELGQNALWGKDLQEVIKQFKEAHQQVKANKFYRVKRAEKEGISASINGIVDVLDSYYRLIKGSATVNDANKVLYYAMRELSRDQDSIFGQELINKMWFEASQALIIGTSGTAPLWGNDPNVSALLPEARKYLEIPLEGPIGKWYVFRENTIMPLREFLEKINPEKVQEPSSNYQALYSILQEKYVSLALRMIEDPVFQKEEFSSTSDAKMFWYSGAPGAGKDLFINFFKQKVRWLRNFTHETVGMAKPVLLTERGVRQEEVQGVNYHYVLRELLQSELTKRMFESTTTEEFTYDDLIERLRQDALVDTNVDIENPDGSVTKGNLINPRLVLARGQEGIEMMLPAMLRPEIRQKIASILISSAEMSLKLTLPEILITAVVNKQRQAMAIRGFVQHIHFYIAPDGTQNVVWEEGVTGRIATVHGLENLLKLPQLVMAEVGRGFALQLQERFKNSSRVFICPITREELEARFNDSFSYVKAYELAMDFHERDINIKAGGEVRTIEDKDIAEGSGVIDPIAAEKERENPIMRWEEIIKYEAVKNIHSRNIKEGGTLTDMKDLRQRAEEAAIQVLEVLHKPEIEAAHKRQDPLVDKYYRANGNLGTYTWVIENKRQQDGKEFLRQTFDLGNKFIRLVLDPVLDMAMFSGRSSNASIKVLSGWLGAIRNERLKINSGTNVSGQIRQYGGIDLNQIDVHRSGKAINIRFNQEQLSELMKGGFEGFTPVIIDMTPIQSPFQLLGENSAGEEETLVKT